MATLDAEVAVVGLGAMGSSALWRMAMRGHDVIGFEQFTIGHNHGSSHGESRVFRTLCLEHPTLVDVARTSRSLLRELEKSEGEELLVMSGAIMIGEPETDVIAGVVAAAESHNIPLEELDAVELARRYPQHENLSPRDIGIWDAEAGAVRPEATVTAAVNAARAAGARVIDRTAVSAIDFDDDAVIITAGGSTFRVGQVIVSTGAWLGKFLPQQPLRPLRTPMTWFEPKAGHEGEFDLDKFPVFIRAVDDGQRLWGHGAAFGHAAKIGPEDSTDYREVDADRLDKAVSSQDYNVIGELVRQYMPRLDPTPSRVTTCMITRSPDMQFQLGRLKSEPRLIVAGGDSGHAFKHAPGIGEYLAQIALGEKTYVDLSYTDPNRFGGA